MERKKLQITFHDPNPPGKMKGYMIKVLGSGISERVKTSVLDRLKPPKLEQCQPQAVKKSALAAYER